MFEHIQKQISSVISGQIVYPLIVELHLGQECSSNCVMCFSHSSEYEERQDNRKQFLRPMDKVMLGKLLNDCRKGGVKEIWFSGGKEPLMADTAIDAIGKANGMGFVTRVYTNGEFLDTQEKQKVALGCNQVRFSLDAVNNDTYDKIHFPGSETRSCLMHRRAGKRVFELKVIPNIKALIRSKRERAAKVKIAVSQIIQPLNYNELLDFIEMAYALGVDSVQVRAESVGTVRPFTESEKELILGQVYEINRRNNSGRYGKMEIDLRGITKDELYASKDKEQFLPGIKKAKLCYAGAFKRGVNPWGKVYHCEFSMHPQNARVEPYRSRKIGDLREKNFTEILADAAGKYPPTCQKCQSHEYAMNIAIDNLVGDYYRTVPSDGQLDSTGVNEIALVGLGRWGGRAVLNTLTRRFPDMVIHAVARSNYQQWLSRKGLPHNVKIHTAKRYEEEILNNPTIKVVIITTQFTTHYGLAKKALLAGKDVFVEKPFTKTAGEAEKLIKIAKENNRILAIGYEFMYDQNINHLKRAIVKNRLGKVSEAEFNMLNPLGDRKLDTSSNVIEDLATHMLSLAQLLFGKKRISELKLDTNSYGTGVFISFKYDGIKITLNVDRKYKRAKRKSSGRSL